VIRYNWDLNLGSFDPGPNVLTTRPQISTRIKLSVVHLLQHTPSTHPLHLYSAQVRGIGCRGVGMGVGGSDELPTAIFEVHLANLSIVFRHS
jgi:hypothetical protein